MFLIRYSKLVAHYTLPWVWFHYSLCMTSILSWYWTLIECMLEVCKFLHFLNNIIGSEDQTWLIVCMHSQDCYFSFLNHAVPFLSHVGTLRNFIQVIILHTKFIRSTAKLPNIETCLYLTFPIPLSPSFVYALICTCTRSSNSKNQFYTSSWKNCLPRRED